MNTRIKDTLSTELMYIGGIGFLFEVSPNLKYNLIGPDVIAFFDSVPESGEVTKDCAFPSTKPNTNISYSLFKPIGYKWIICSDGVLKKCPKIKCDVEYKSSISTLVFIIDRTFVGETISGFVSL